MWDIISRDYNRNMRYALPRTLEKIRQMGLKCKAIEF